jgi:hypothetical protein
MTEETTGDNLQSTPPAQGTGTGGQVTGETPTDTSTESPTQTTESTDKTQSTDGDLQGFKSPDELAKAYKELRTKMSQRDDKGKIVDTLTEKTGMSTEQIAEEITKLAQQQEAQQMPEPQPSRYLGDESATNPQMPKSLKDQVSDDRKYDALARAVYEQKEDTELDRLVKTYPEAEPFKEQIRRIGRVETNKTHEDIFKEVFQPAVQAGTDKAYKGIDAKEQSQVQSGEGSGVAQQSEQELYQEAKKTGDWSKLMDKRIRWNKSGIKSQQ